MTVVYVLGGLYLVWLLMSFKTSRPDGTYIKTHPYRRMMFFLFPTRNESVVYFDDYVRADNFLRWIAEAREKMHCDVTHLSVAAYALSLYANPKMDRFTVGRRLYQRKRSSISFSMKRKKLGREAKIAVVKMHIQDDDTLASYLGRINDKIGVERSDKKTYTDKELNLFLRLPRPLLNAAIRFFYWLDYHNCLPGAFIDADVMYTSGFIANLGSLHMNAGYHHLYEWGTCPLFLMLGQIQERAMVEDGQVVARKVLHVRFSFDERIDDGLNAGKGIDTYRTVLEDPHRYLGDPKADDFGSALLKWLPDDPRLKAPGAENIPV
ncbi:MAG: 2-oxo acid dehydrogenase subunit E2 [Myxococcota bacterium]|nr:2-oxo acid dehydrogenase subunit E2 [Myxococcota bacterium]